MTVTEGALGQLPHGTTHLLQRDDVAPTLPQPGVEPTTVRSPNPVDVEGRDPQHASERMPWLAGRPHRTQPVVPASTAASAVLSANFTNRARKASPRWALP